MAKIHPMKQISAARFATGKQRTVIIGHHALRRRLSNAFIGKHAEVPRDDYVHWIRTTAHLQQPPDHLIKTEVPLDSPPLRLKIDLENLVPIEQVHAARDEGEVVAAAGDGELSNENAFWVPAVKEIYSQLSSNLTLKVDSRLETYTSTPSPLPQAEYTLPAVSVWMPSGMPLLAYAKSCLLCSLLPSSVMSKR